MKKMNGFIFLLFVLTTFLSSCSSLKLAWNNLERIALFRLTDYVELSGEERREVKDQISRFKNNQFTRSLPAIVEDIEEWKTAMNAAALSQDEVYQRIEASDKLSQSFRWALGEEAAAFIEKLSLEQKQGLAIELATRIKKQEEELNHPSKIKKKINARFENTMKRFFGRVESSQKEILDQVKEETQAQHALQLKCRSDYVEGYAHILNDNSAVKNYVKKYVADHNSISQPECQQLWREQRQRWAKTIALIHPLLTHRQKDFFNKRMDDWKKDLISIYEKQQ